MVSAVPKPQRGGDGGDRLAGVLEPAARGLEAHALDVARGRDAGLGAEGAGEVARAHVGARGHRLDGVIAGDVLEHGALDLAQRLALGALRGERGAELGLVAGAAQEQHEVAGDVSAASRSRSSSTSASARSMPAVTPAEVQIGPSRTKIGSGSTRTCG